MFEQWCSFYNERRIPILKVFVSTLVEYLDYLWDVQKVLDLLHAWEKPLVLNYICLTQKTVMILALATVKRPSELNLLRNTPGAMQILEDSITFQQCLGLRMPDQITHMVQQGGQRISAYAQWSL